MHEPSADIELRIRSDPRLLSVVRAAVEAAARRMGMGERAALELVASVDEAVCNVIRHGYRDAADQPVWISLRELDRGGRKALEVRIEDRTGCRPEDIAPRPFDPARPGGLGMNIIQRSMDTVCYDQRPDGSGLVQTLCKYLDPEPPATSRE